MNASSIVRYEAHSNIFLLIIILLRQLKATAPVSTDVIV